MDLKTLQKAIHDVAMAVRSGDWSQYEKLQALRKEHRKLCGVPEAEEPAAPTEAEVAEPIVKEEKPKAKKKKEQEQE